jgi:hypothetical protein
MCEIDDLILTRRYYFSLDPQQIFQHLMNRDVPEILEIKERDYLYELYINLDRVDDSPDGKRYKNNLCWKYIALIKETKRIYTSRKKVKIELLGKIYRPPDYQLFHYYGGSVIEGKYCPFFVGEKKIHFQFRYYRSVFDFLKRKLFQGVCMADDPNLSDLSDSISFDVLFFKYCLTKKI